MVFSTKFRLRLIFFYILFWMVFFPFFFIFPVNRSVYFLFFPNFFILPPTHLHII